jgi:hypothetical protein
LDDVPSNPSIFQIPAGVLADYNEIVLAYHPSGEITTENSGDVIYLCNRKGYLFEVVFEVTRPYIHARRLDLEATNTLCETEIARRINDPTKGVARPGDGPIPDLLKHLFDTTEPEPYTSCHQPLHQPLSIQRREEQAPEEEEDPPQAEEEAQEEAQEEAEGEATPEAQEEAEGEVQLDNPPPPQPQYKATTAPWEPSPTYSTATAYSPTTSSTK